MPIKVGGVKKYVGIINKIFINGLFEKNKIKK